MMKPILLALAFAALAEQAQALRCIRPNPMQTFAQIAAAPEDYYVLYGTLTFDQSIVPKGLRDVSEPMPAPIPAQFIGKGLTQDGFASDFISPVVLHITCAAHYCGSAQSGERALYFVRAEQSAITLTVGACGGTVFPAPSQAVLDQMTACMQDGC